MAMTPEEHDLVTRTPDLAAPSFTNLFGGSSDNERPQTRKWGTLCVNRDTQPYAPHSPGASGLVFTYPDAVRLEDTCETFLLFLNINPKPSKSGKRQIRYLGTYTKVPIVHATVEKGEWQSLPNTASGIFQHFLPSARLVRLFLMARCSVVTNGYIVFILHREAKCVKHMQEYLYANRVRVGPHLQQMPFASGLNNIQRNGTASKERILGTHFIQVKRWVLDINFLSCHENNIHHTRNWDLRS